MAFHGSREGASVFFMFAEDTRCHKGIENAPAIEKCKGQHDILKKAAPVKLCSDWQTKVENEAHSKE
jgi:hypothetical protein